MRFFFRVLVFTFLFSSCVFKSAAIAIEAQSQDLKQAIDIWRKQAQKYSSQGNPQEIDTRLLISQGLISLGQFNGAIAELNRIILLATDDEILALAYKRLGDAYKGTGKLEPAVVAYQKSLEYKNSLVTVNSIVKALLDQRSNLLFQASRVQNQKEISGYTTQADRATIEAERYAKKAIELQDNSSLATIEALINWHKLPDRKLTAQQLEQGRRLIRALPSSTAALFNILSWAKIDQQNQEIWLHLGRDMAYDQNEPAMISYAMLALAEFYEQSLQLEKALRFTLEAQETALKTSNYNILFRVQTLLGRLNVAQNQHDLALDAYRGAITSIDKLNTDTNLNSPVQIVKFNQEIEPIYRNALELLLKDNANQQRLGEAIEVADKLKLAQLRRYFGDNCFALSKKVQQVQRQQINTPTIRSIILKDRLIILAQLPDGRILQSQTDIPKAELTKRVKQWSYNLTEGFSWSFRTDSLWLYQVLIKPFEKELEALQPEVITFVHDGILRNVPMAALNDGEKYLAQKWASVSSLGLNYDYDDDTSDSPQLDSALALGLVDVPTQQNLATLEFVPEELTNVKELFGGKKILGEQFTVSNFANQLTQNQYPLVHLATHGYFAGTAETSYVHAYDQKIPILMLDDIIRQNEQSAPQFLVLSACETALGSDLSLLGLAGLAARTGIDTTLGSLWFIKDKEQSQIIQSFYDRVENQNQSKAVALQEIQKELIEGLAHPVIWSSLTLIGDWH